MLYTTHMHTLIVTAHPSAKGFTHQIAQAYRETKEGSGHEVTTLDLYTPAHSGEFLRFASLEELHERNKKQTEIQKMIKLADEVVFVFPTWWYDVPAVLKNMIDVHFTSGFAFNYSSRGITGLLTGKRYKVFTTSAAPGWVYTLGLIPHCRSFMRSLKDCGFRRTEYVVFGGRRSNGQEQALEDKWLKRVRESANRPA